ncbi:hypothetical protein D7V78_16790 [Parabacteroides distasonis]|uniref:Transposase IS66 family protein n=1 Tax=Parabacteroides distasonis TaxID=823 RepID=A0A3L7ZMX3_PARDI|nr:hypothetical protein [Parabacteroides distasonis]RLT72252.1 hypothetical protein D7V78_16790 [Parabacteroides distasonis]
MWREILRRVESSPVVGADETGEYPDGGSHWMWVCQNEMATYIFPDPSRGKNAMYEHFPDGLPGSVPVSICGWPATNCAWPTWSGTKSISSNS